MPLTQSQIQELKTQLKSQIQNLPAEQKAEAIKQIEQMSPEALETMLQQQSQTPEIFRQIINKQIPVIVAGENPKALAVLDNKPISKGHIVIIPKTQAKTSKEITKPVYDLAESLSKKLTENLKAKSVRVETETKFNESVVNLIPIYDKPLTLQSPRSEAPPEQLKEIKKSLEVIKIEKKPGVIKVKKPRRQKPLKLKRRIP